MAFDSVERSAESGRPVEIYQFAREAQVWRFTSADRPVELDSFIFQPRPIERSEIDVSSEVARAGLTLTVSREFEIAKLFRENPTSAAVTCVLRRYHAGDGELATMWTGRVIGVEMRSSISAEIRMEPTYTSIRRTGLRRLYQRQCPHVLYGPQCGANKELHRVDGALIDNPVGYVVTVPEAATKPDGWAAGGMIEYITVDGVPERRFVMNHVGADLTLSSKPWELYAGMTVKIFAGCDHTIETCRDKFANARRYGGMPYFTKKNPFNGDPVY